VAAKSPRINQCAAITIHYDGMLRRPALHLLRFRGGIYELLVDGSEEKREAPSRLNYEGRCNRVLIVFEQRTVVWQSRIDDSRSRRSRTIDRSFLRRATRFAPERMIIRDARVRCVFHGNTVSPLQIRFAPCLYTSSIQRDTFLLCVSCPCLLYILFLPREMCFPAGRNGMHTGEAHRFHETSSADELDYPRNLATTILIRARSMVPTIANLSFIAHQNASNVSNVRT